MHSNHERAVMTDLDLVRGLCTFIEQSPSMFHTAATIMDRLDAAGFRRLAEQDAWSVSPGDACYVTRNASSVIAFKVGAGLAPDGIRFQIAAAHGDSPAFKVKHLPELDGAGGTLRLDVEAYGGMIDSTWFDRPLGIAGRVLVRSADGRAESRLIASAGDVALIPNVAIHQNREVNKGFALNRQVDLCPLFSAGALGRGAFDAMVAELAGTAPDAILGKDLFLCNRTAPRIWGWADEFVSAPKLDDLQCAFSALTAFLAAENPACITVFACFDNEEVGSGTKQGALSTFLHDVLVRVSSALGTRKEDHLRALARSFLVSCDNGHAIHPNHPELFDAENCGRVNGGVLIKEAANQKYATDAFSRALFAELCVQAGVPVQTFANHSASQGGSTLGNLSNQQVSVHAVDVGLAQLAMHSSYETAGVADTGNLVRALAAFFSADIAIEGADSFEVHAGAPRM